MVTRLEMLSKSLPSDIAPKMRQLNQDVEKLFTQSFPLTLTHDDLCEMNIIVDPGIIDWADARIVPFGLAS